MLSISTHRIFISMMNKSQPFKGHLKDALIFRNCYIYLRLNGAGQ